MYCDECHLGWRTDQSGIRTKCDCAGNQSQNNVVLYGSDGSVAVIYDPDAGEYKYYDGRNWITIGENFSIDPSETLRGGRDVAAKTS